MTLSNRINGTPAKSEAIQPAKRLSSAEEKKDLDAVSGALKVVPPFAEAVHGGKEFLVVDFIVHFGRSQLS